MSIFEGYGAFNLFSMTRVKKNRYLWTPFPYNEEVKAAVYGWINTKGPKFFISWMMTLEYSWAKCITLQEGNCIEKEEVHLDRKSGRLVTY